jgi:FkbM family methyltransferase
MDCLAGPKMYYSILGFRGLLLGAQARLLNKRIEVSVRHPHLRYPVHLRLRTTDVALCGEILVLGLYDCDMATPPRVIVDGGANIGLASIFYAQKYPDARIIAIEPERSNYEMLVKNTACYPRITPVLAALWKSEKELDVVDVGAGHTTFQTQETTEAPMRGVIARTKAITVGRLMAEFGISAIDLLKIDIEGAEKDLFDGRTDWLKRVGVIAVEFHERMRPGSTASVRAATPEFEDSWTQGDVTYLARKGLAAPKRPAARSDSLLPLRILEAI